jgi:hypothetical protein
MLQALKNGCDAPGSPFARSPFMQHHADTAQPDLSAERERGAYNRAFSELGLEWYWDRGTYRQLTACTGDKHCIEAYIEAHHPHLLHAYDAGSLAAAIDHVRRRLSEAVPH